MTTLINTDGDAILCPGNVAVRTRTVIDGRSVEIDLSATIAHAVEEAMREHMRKYHAHAL